MCSTATAFFVIMFISRWVAGVFFLLLLVLLLLLLVLLLFFYSFYCGKKERAELALFVSLCRGNCIHVWFGVRVSHNREKRAPTHAHSDSIIMCIMHFVHLSPCTIFFCSLHNVIIAAHAVVVVVVAERSRFFSRRILHWPVYVRTHMCNWTHRPRVQFDRKGE